jgi:hypothetical protein
MELEIVEIHPAKDKKTLNSEWFLLKNVGDSAFSTKNCVVSVSRRGQKKRVQLGTLDPGFTIAPGESVRLVTGNPGRKAHGAMPAEDETRNYSLFLGEQILKGPGTVLSFALRSHEITSAEFDPKAKTGVRANS